MSNQRKKAPNWLRFGASVALHACVSLPSYLNQFNGFGDIPFEFSLFQGFHDFLFNTTGDFDDDDVIEFSQWTTTD